MKQVTSEPSDPILQNRDYNGWTGDYNHNVLLLWDPFGRIANAVVNSTGNFHDSRAATWGDIYDHISLLHPPYRVVCDSAFQTGGVLIHKLIKSHKKNTSYDGEGAGVAATHLRQCSEWGNANLTGTFRRLKRRLPTDNTKRGHMWWTCILLFNYQTCTMGRNQIQTYFELVNGIESDEL